MEKTYNQQQTIFPESNSDQEKSKNAAAIPLTDEEKLERSFDLGRVYMISQVREGALPQFDGMGYSKYNETNEMADISYIAPKKNKMESRLTTGITHEKDTTLVSMMEGFNFEGRVHVFKGTEEIYDLSQALTSWVRKSREEENYDEKRPINYRNLFAQGTAFTVEKYLERYVPNKIFDQALVDFTRLETLNWKQAGYKKVEDRCESDLVDGKKVFLEDIRQWDIRKQPRVYTVEYVPRLLMSTIWGKSERWSWVPEKCAGSNVLGFITQGSIYSDWTFGEIDMDKMEVIQCYDQFNNRYQIYLNGIPMLPAAYPLTAISPSGCVPMAKGDIDTMQLFAYSKSVPAKTKVDQAVFDEFLRVLVIKFQQSAFAPRGNMADVIVDQNIFMPGRMTAGVTAEDFPALGEFPGPTQSDFSIFNLLKEQIDSKSVSSILEGEGGSSSGTLGEYLDKQKKQMLKMGRYFDAVINWEKQMLHLRTMNLLANGTKPKSQYYDPATQSVKKQYKDVAISDKFDSGKSGTNVLKFTTENTMSPYEVQNQETAAQDATGKEVRYTYIDPEQAREMLTDPEYCFFYEVVPVDKNNDKLSQAMFVAMITQAMNIFGPDSMNVSSLKQRYASVFGEDFDKIFLDEATLQQQRQAAEQAAMAAQAAGMKPGAGGTVGGGIQMPKPSMPAAAQTMFQ